MGVKKINSKIIATFIVVGSLAIIGLLLNWTQSDMNDAVIGTTLNETQQVGKQLELLIETTLEDAEDDLSRLADYISKNEIPLDEIKDFLAGQAQSEEFDNLYYIDIYGKGISLTNSEQDFSNNISFEYALKKELFIAEPQISYEKNIISLGVAVPVIKDNAVMAVLYGETSLSNFFDLLKRDTGKIDDIYFVDENLNLIFSTDKLYKNSTRIPEDEMLQIGLENIAQAQVRVSEGKGGGFSYDYYGTTKIMTYFPIKNSTWALLINMEIAPETSILTLAVQSFKIVATIVYWSVILLVIYISFAQIRSNKKLIKTAYYDNLTALPNLAKLKLDMSTILEENVEENNNKQYAILKFDIENFKVINDMYGFNIGDKVLKGIKSWSESLNNSSLITARINADEFMMFALSEVLEDVKKLDELTLEHYNKILPQIAHHQISFKTGRYLIEKGEIDIDEILNKVTLAHKIAKTTKGMSYCNYDNDFKKMALREAEIKNKMKTALANNEFKVYLQPKIDVYEKKLVGAEALIRWIEADGTMLKPDEFVPIFERNGFIVEIDKYVLENVCMTIRKWIDMGLGKFPISVNCSRLNLDNPFFVDGVVAIADKHNVPHECIEIELTESTTIESELTIEDLFASLRHNNFKISIDDFGAGYSSLGMLKNLNVDTLKMDRSFFISGKSARRDDMLIDSIIKMSHNLGMYVVAEGIETNEQVELLKSLNCDAIQGYVYAKPMPIEEFENEYGATMKKNSALVKAEIPLIHEINDAKFANSFVPCGILIAEIDEYIPITEANQGFFDLIGYSREEMRDIYKNRGCETLHPQDSEAAMNYLMEQISTNPHGTYEYSCRLVNKYCDYVMVRFNGKVAMNEMGKLRVYMTITDISDFAKADTALQNVRDFETSIASLMNDAFFDYNIETKTIRFSSHFAKKFKLPEVINNFIDSKIREKIFPHFQSIIYNENEGQLRSEGQFCIMLPNGNPVWFLYNSNLIHDEKGTAYRLIGKLTQVIGHNLEMDILRVKSETDSLTNVYNKQATERFIRSYLRIASHSDNTGAFLVINLDNFSKINETFGREYGDECLKEIATLLRNYSRSSDIIGRIEGDEFFLFIGNYKELQFLEKKANELCLALNKIYEKDGKSVEITASIGISLYPEHGRTFNKVYEKANIALHQIKKSGKNGYKILK